MTRLISPLSRRLSAEVPVEILGDVIGAASIGLSVVALFWLPALLGA